MICCWTALLSVGFTDRVQKPKSVRTTCAARAGTSSYKCTGLQGLIDSLPALEYMNGSKHLTNPPMSLVDSRPAAMHPVQWSATRASCLSTGKLETGFGKLPGILCHKRKPGSRNSLACSCIADHFTRRILRQLYAPISGKAHRHYNRRIRRVLYPLA